MVLLASLMRIMPHPAINRGNLGSQNQAKILLGSLNQARNLLEKVQRPQAMTRSFAGDDPQDPSQPRRKEPRDVVVSPLEKQRLQVGDVYPPEPTELEGRLVRGRVAAEEPTSLRGESPPGRTWRRDPPKRRTPRRYPFDAKSLLTSLRQINPGS